MGRESVVTPAIQSTSSMNHLFLKTVTGEINHDIINEELTRYIRTIAERYYTIDKDTRKGIIKGIKEREYFKNKPLDEVERLLNEAITHLTGEEHADVAHYYTYLIETARKGG